MAKRNLETRRGTGKHHPTRGKGRYLLNTNTSRIDRRLIANSTLSSHAEKKIQDSVTRNVITALKDLNDYDQNRLDIPPAKQVIQYIPIPEKILQYAIEVIGTHRAAMKWLTTKSIALGSATPVELMLNEEGVNEVERELGRIESGVL